MVAVPTSRLGLLKPDPNDSVDVEIINDNYDNIDRVAGMMLVNNNVTPPNGDLFDGAIVKEKNTGWVWVAESNGSGGFNKRLIHAPLSVGMSSNAVIANWTSGNPIPVSNSSDHSMNWTAKNGTIQASGCRIPNMSNWFTGDVWWRFDVWVSFASNGTGSRLFGMVDVDGTGALDDRRYCSLAPVSGIAMITQATFYEKLPATHNDRWNLAIRQNSGGSLGVNSFWQITLDPRNLQL